MVERLSTTRPGLGWASAQVRAVTRFQQAITRATEAESVFRIPNAPILATDPERGVATRMLRFAPGTDTSAAGPQIHDFWEEVYIVEGALHDLTLNQTFPAGTYACRPPGMRHGPWTAADGCLTFEMRYAR